MLYLRGEIAMYHTCTFDTDPVSTTCMYCYFNK